MLPLLTIIAAVQPDQHWGWVLILSIGLALVCWKWMRCWFELEAMKNSRRTPPIVPVPIRERPVGLPTVPTMPVVPIVPMVPAVSVPPVLATTLADVVAPPKVFCPAKAEKIARHHVNRHAKPKHVGDSQGRP